MKATRITHALHGDDVRAVGSWCRYLSSTAHLQAWSDLVASVRTGEPAFHGVHGRTLFEWFDGHPDEGEHFTRGLAGLTLADAPFVLAALELPDRGVVCDVAGGGRGVLLAEILQARPKLRGILLEYEAVLIQAKDYLSERGLLDRVELRQGDIFAPLQVTADLYLLKWILHDWNDATCLRLLTGLSATMPSGSRAVVIEGLQEANVVDPRFSMIDLEMLLITEGGRERSADQLRRLITAAGLTPTHRWSPPPAQRSCPRPCPPSTWTGTANAYRSICARTGRLQAAKYRRILRGARALSHFRVVGCGAHRGPLSAPS